MNRFQRAFQIWPLLALCAHLRRTLSYQELGSLIGVPPAGLGQLLEPIQSYCLKKRYPALSSLVVGGETGIPGAGFIAAKDTPGEHSRVFNFDWMSKAPPTPEKLEKATMALPTNGKSLSVLLRKLGRKP